MDDLTRATPRERVVRRQLRRSLVALGATARGVSAESGVDEARAVIDRLHPPILGLDARGAIVAASRGAERLLGFTRQELVATTVFGTGFGTDLPLAGLWQAAVEGRRGPATLSVRDRGGRQVTLEAVLGPVAPGLQALVFASAAP